MKTELNVTVIAERGADTITQLELRSYRAKENLIKDLQAELKVQASDVEAALDAGAVVEFGPHTAEFETVTGRRSVSWKGIVEREMGKGYAANVFKHTKPADDKRKLVIK